MPLGPNERVRYSRHILLNEIGADGQERLLAGLVRLQAPAWPFAEYLARAGVRLSDSDGSLPQRTAPSAFTSDPALLAVAEVLAGSLDAVECLKGLLGVGTPSDPSTYPSLSPARDDA